MEVLRQSVLRARLAKGTGIIERIVHQPPIENKSVESEPSEISEIKRRLDDSEKKLKAVMHMLELDDKSLVHAPKYLRVSDIRKLVCAYLDVTEQDLDWQGKTGRIVRARHIAMYLSRQHTQQSLPVIGKLFGDRDHTTILHAVRKIGNARTYDDKIASDLAELERQLTDLMRQRMVE